MDVVKLPEVEPVTMTAETSEMSDFHLEVV